MDRSGHIMCGRRSYTSSSSNQPRRYGFIQLFRLIRLSQFMVGWNRSIYGRHVAYFSW